MRGVPPLRLLALNFVAAFVWALSFAGFGYVFGQALEAVLGDIVHTFGMVMLSIFAAVIGTIVSVHRQQQRRFAQRAALRGSLVTGDSAPPA